MKNENRDGSTYRGARLNLAPEKLRGPSLAPCDRGKSPGSGEVRDIPGQQNSGHCRALVLMDTGKGFEQFFSSLLDGALESRMWWVL